LNQIRQIQRNATDKTNFFFSDTPIYKSGQELLGRKRFVADLYNEINQIPFCDSFVIGLNGKWGEGKTSIINLLNSEFESQKNDKFIRIIFDPWHFKDEDAILAAFYDQLDRAISECFMIPDLKKDLLQYQRIIKTGISLGIINVNLSGDSISIRELKEKIQAALVKTNRKFLIFIDDLDRLHPSEVLLVFKLVRLNANFVNTIFILSYDQIVIHDYLSDQKININYLEKIIQKQIDIPVVNQARLEVFLFDQLNRLFNSLNVTAEQAMDFETRIINSFSNEINHFFGTLRDIKRFLNGLRTTLPPIVSEINLADFFILELIRIEYPKIYRDIGLHAAFYVESRSLFLGLNEDVRDAKIRQHIDKLMLNEKEPDLLLELLQELFVVVKKAFGKGLGFSDFTNEDRAKKRIRHPDCFHKYFVLEVFEGELSDSYIETAIGSLLIAGDRYIMLDQIMNELIQKNQWSEFLQRIWIFKEKITEELADFLVEFICQNSKKFEVHHADLYDPIKLVMNLIENKINEDKIESIFLDIVRKTNGKTFLVELIGSCLDGGYYKVYNKVDRKRIIDVASDHLKEYFIEQKKDIFDELTDKKNLARVLYSWGVQWENFVDNKKMLEDYIFLIIERNVNKLSIFLDILPRIHFDETRRFDFEKIKTRYDLNKLKQIIRSFEIPKAFEPEQWELVSKFLTELDLFESTQ